MLTPTEIIFKKNLCQLREKSNLSKKKLSELLEIDDAYYRRLENPDKSVAPRFATLEKIANYYNIPVHYLFLEDFPSQTSAVNVLCFQNFFDL